jgi:PAS domain S-box-containing protein
MWYFAQPPFRMSVSRHTLFAAMPGCALFRAAFAQSRNPMALLNKDRLHVEVNTAYAELFGYTVDDLIGRPTYILLPEWRNNLESWPDIVNNLMEFTGSRELFRADGSTVYVEFALHPTIEAGETMVLAVVLEGAPPPGESVGALSQREAEVVRLIVEGLTDREIAAELFLSEHTVHNHVRNARVKLGARSRAQLIALALDANFSRRWRSLPCVNGTFLPLRCPYADVECA